ncbi:MAG: SPFH domain-containing protein [Hymenobacteraceae bacterium]|nr:SPFH domain-containing protein [Hymenobacteraceae bacterium]MDX5395797.1 SPFH domain-containing protein [Hymenobacteraceae bacterium]MDX5511852.1 SPFH domain-containing protein [Hymenobacteraceae bacterium]
MEKEYKGLSGYLGLLIILGLLGLAIAAFALWELPIVGIAAALALILSGIGLVVVNPNESSVLVLFGDYKGTIKQNGFWWVNPFFVKKKISLRARNLDSDPIKVNDKVGNPIMIGVVLVWRVENTFKAAFEVNDYEHFVRVQSEAAIRKLAGSFSYDNFDDEQAEITLRSSADEVSHMLEQELTERLHIAGIQVMEARISYLAYASEIAGAMLQRQQATAIVAARIKIVEGAVGMVEMALKELAEKRIIDMDEHSRTALVSNLMVVLCSDRGTQPVVDTGSVRKRG